MVDVIPEVIKHATVLISSSTRLTLLWVDCAGLVQAPTTGYWSSYMIPPWKTGRSKNSACRSVQEYIVESYVHVRPGDQVDIWRLK